MSILTAENSFRNGLMALVDSRHTEAADFFHSAMTPDKNARNNKSSKFGLYHMNRNGNRELLAYDDAVSIAHPALVIKRKRPQDQG